MDFPIWQLQGISLCECRAPMGAKLRSLWLTRSKGRTQSPSLISQAGGEAVQINILVKQCLLTTLPKATQNPKLGVTTKLTPFQLRGCLSSLYLPRPPRTLSWTHAVRCRAINLFLIPKGSSPVKIYFLHSDFCLISNFWNIPYVKCKKY